MRYTDIMKKLGKKAFGFALAAQALLFLGDLWRKQEGIN